MAGRANKLWQRGKLLIALQWSVNIDSNNSDCALSVCLVSTAICVNRCCPRDHRRRVSRSQRCARALGVSSVYKAISKKRSFPTSKYCQLYFRVRKHGTVIYLLMISWFGFTCNLFTAFPCSTSSIFKRLPTNSWSLTIRPCPDWQLKGLIILIARAIDLMLMERRTQQRLERLY